MNQRTDFSNLIFKRIKCLDDNKEVEPEHFFTKENYSYQNIKKLKQIDSYPGFFPFLRGFSSTGYLLKPWETKPNEFYFNPKKYYNFDHENFSSVKDILSKLENNSSNNIFILTPTNKKALIHFVYFLMELENTKWEKEKLRINLISQFGNYSNLKVLIDCIIYINNNKSNCYDLSIINDFSEEDSLNIVIDSFVKNYQIIKIGLEKGLKIDSITPFLSLFLPISQNVIDEVCKLRAIRIVWAKLIDEFSPQNYDSYKIKIHSFLKKQVSKEKNQQIFDATNESLSAIMGAVESMTTNTNGIEENIQLILQDETQICRTIDPLGGSFLIESITNDFAIEIYKRIKEKFASEKIIKDYQWNIKNNWVEIIINNIKSDASFNKICSILNLLEE